MITHNMQVPKAGVTFKDGEFVIVGLQGETVARFGSNQARARAVCTAMNAEIERQNSK